MFKAGFLVLGVLFVSSAFADSECIAYKIKPEIKLTRPDWVKKVVQPLKVMDLYHGNVVATFVDEYDVSADIHKLPDNSGFCVGIKNIDAVIGYSEFLVKIDMRHKFGSCSYNTVLSHEDEHINAYISIINDFQNDLKKSLNMAANSITPIFVKNKNDIDLTIDNLHHKLQNHPELILVKQKISAAQELRNAKIDSNGKHYKELDKCND